MISLECRNSSVSGHISRGDGYGASPYARRGRCSIAASQCEPFMRRPGRFCTLLLILLALCGTRAARAAEDQFLPPEQVFRYSVTSAGASVGVHWNLPPGYYAYKSRMTLLTGTPGVTLGAAVYPQGEVHKDDYFGAQEVFRGAFVITAPVTLAPDAPRRILLKLKIQGCADAGLCYPPQLSNAKLELPATAASGVAGGIDSILGARRQRARDDHF